MDESNKVIDEFFNKIERLKSNDNEYFKDEKIRREYYEFYSKIISEDNVFLQVDIYEILLISKIITFNYNNSKYLNDTDYIFVASVLSSEPSSTFYNYVKANEEVFKKYIENLKKIFINDKFIMRNTSAIINKYETYQITIDNINEFLKNPNASLRDVDEVRTYNFDIISKELKEKVSKKILDIRKKYFGNNEEFDDKEIIDFYNGKFNDDSIKMFDKFLSLVKLIKKNNYPYEYIVVLLETYVNNIIKGIYPTTIIDTYRLDKLTTFAETFVENNCAIIKINNSFFTHTLKSIKEGNDLMLTDALRHAIEVINHECEHVEQVNSLSNGVFSLDNFLMAADEVARIIVPQHYDDNYRLLTSEKNAFLLGKTVNNSLKEGYEISYLNKEYYEKFNEDYFIRKYNSEPKSIFELLELFLKNYNMKDIFNQFPQLSIIFNEEGLVKTSEELEKIQKECHKKIHDNIIPLALPNGTIHYLDYKINLNDMENKYPILVGRGLFLDELFDKATEYSQNKKNNRKMH